MVVNKQKVNFSNGLSSIDHTPGQSPCPGVVGQHKIDSILCMWAFFKNLFYWFSFIFPFFSFFFFFLRKREHEVALGREVGGPGKIREGKIRLHCRDEVWGSLQPVLFLFSPTPTPYNRFWTMLFLTRIVSPGRTMKGLFWKDRIKLWNVDGVWQVEIEKRKINLYVFKKRLRVYV